MLGNSGKRHSKYGAFYDLPVLMMSVPLTSARRQGMVENLFKDPVSELHGQSMYKT
jgi:hypothetical protein